MQFCHRCIYLVEAANKLCHGWMRTQSFLFFNLLIISVSMELTSHKQARQWPPSIASYFLNRITEQSYPSVTVRQDQLKYNNIEWKARRLQ